jgi:hypothetical protein
MGTTSPPAVDRWHGWSDSIVSTSADIEPSDSLPSCMRRGSDPKFEFRAATARGQLLPRNQAGGVTVLVAEHSPAPAEPSISKSFGIFEDGAAALPA